MDKSTNFDERLKEALLKKAMGYDVEEKEVIADRAGRPEKVRIRKRHIPPDKEAWETVQYLKAIGKW